MGYAQRKVAITAHKLAHPPPRSTLAAFTHRIGFGNVVPSMEVIQQACTHPSFVPQYTQDHPDQPLPATNASMATLGNSSLSATSASDPVLHDDALASVPRALTALVYQYRSLHAARRFAEKFFFSREVDMKAMIKFKDPKQSLLNTVAKFGRERPISRLLKETGRFSGSPVFVVGIFTGADKLGEGFGSSLKMAEYRAAEDSLLRLYLTRQPPHLLQLPTSTFPDSPGNVFDAVGAEGAYAPVALGDSEVLYGSAGRAGTRVPGARSFAVGADNVEYM
ncbi:ribonuclease III [Epithele typhae]|uniref:ribonuclease III n=1 Tax=Epithele typhae TaxID=378194 RepID=UPI0020086156|nr:ribonuclease III [Epithele typhae]KAH9935933.1 ribonuclease III [Epithele typhae]